MSDARDWPSDDQVLDYVAGRCSDDEAEAVRAAAQTSPELAADIALMQAARRSFATDTAGPGDLGWARLSRAIDGETKAAPAPRRWVGFAATAAASVVAWQFLVVPLAPTLSGPGYAPVSEAPVAGPLLRVVFAPDTREGDLRALLLETGAEVVGGPSALGLWDLAFADVATRDAALALLEASSLVESVQTEE